MTINNFQLIINLDSKRISLFKNGLYCGSHDIPLDRKNLIEILNILNFKDISKDYSNDYFVFADTMTPPAVRNVYIYADAYGLHIRTAKKYDQFKLVIDTEYFNKFLECLGSVGHLVDIILEWKYV